MSGMADAVHCAICEMDITQLGLDSRNYHVEKCLNRNVGMSQPTLVKDTAQLSIAETETLARLATCPICGAEWMQLHCTRSSHVAECSKRHQLSKDDLRSLITLFRESLDNSQSDSTTSTSSKKPKARNADTAFDRAFNILKKGSPSLVSTTSKRSHATPRSVVNKVAPNDCKNKTIDRWFNKQPSSGTDDTEVLDTVVCRRPEAKRATTLEFEVESDDEFQSTKVRVPLRQAYISLMQKRSKRKREFLDDLDDDINEAKALSLSLVRSPTPDQNSASKSKSGSVKRRGVAGSRAENALAVSEVLASGEAQDYIRQRAAALAHLDECSIANSSNDILSLSPATDFCSTGSSSSRLELWHLGSLSEPADREYCPIFEKYKMQHSDHTSGSDCIGTFMEHMLREIALGNMEESKSKSKQAHLRTAYLKMLHTLHCSFDRQSRNMDCMDWVSSSAAPGDGSESAYRDDTSGELDVHDIESDNSEVAALSPPASSTASLSLLEFNQDPLPYAHGKPKINKLKPQHHCTDSRATATPQYAKMDIAHLQYIAAGFGLRVNTSRRLLVHQLQTIWQQTHKNSDRKHNGNKEETSQRTNAQLFSRIREYIRSNTGLYEQVICYQVLDFNTVYQNISAHIQCQRFVLRKYFDSEGIAYSE